MSLVQVFLWPKLADYIAAWQYSLTKSFFCNDTFKDEGICIHNLWHSQGINNINLLISFQKISIIFQELLAIIVSSVKHFALRQT